MSAFVGTLFLGVELGLGIAVAISLLLVLMESAYPHTSVLGRLPGTSEYRSVKQYPDAESYDGMVLVRMDAPMYFANCQNVRDKVDKYVTRASKHDDTSSSIPTRTQYQSTSPVRFILLDLTAVPHMDTSALHALQDMHSSYKVKGIQLCISNPNQLVLIKLLKSGLVEKIGREYLFVTIHEAVHFCLQELDRIELQQEQEGNDNSIRSLSKRNMKGNYHLEVSTEDVDSSAASSQTPIDGGSVPEDEQQDNDSADDNFCDLELATDQSCLNNGA